MSGPKPRRTKTSAKRSTSKSGSKPRSTKATAKRRAGKSKPKPKAGCAENSAQLTRPLGLEGWSHLEPVVLAALASDEPMLLIGKHGTAKSFLLERLAQALELEYRFYNASLVNFDDLVGIPVPDESRTALRYIATPTAIWDAEVVFIDELNRTRPELQNKLFPLIHERRVQGVDLPKLRYRWAAMNPVSSMEEDDEGDHDHPEYLGTEPLDPALADRFVFVIEVPEWGNLSDDEKRRVLFDHAAGEHDFTLDLPQVIARTRRVLYELERAIPKRLVDYLIIVESLIRSKGAYFSARRMTMLMRAVLSIQASRVALLLSGSKKAQVTDVDWECSALLALRHGNPETAACGGSRAVEALEIHKHAWKLSGLSRNNPWRELLTIGDPVERFARALAFGPGIDDDDLGKLALDAVASRKREAERTAVALGCYLAVHRDRAVPATVIETLGHHARGALVPDERTLGAGRRTPSGPSVVAVRDIVGRLKTKAGIDGPACVRDRYLANLLESLLPDGFDGASPDRVAELFLEIWARFHLDSVPIEEQR